jgi:hydrogenase-4 membrane subunit HyfE
MFALTKLTTALAVLFLKNSAQNRVTFAPTWLFVNRLLRILAVSVVELLLKRNACTDQQSANGAVILEKVFALLHSTTATVCATDSTKMNAPMFFQLKKLATFANLAWTRAFLLVIPATVSV